MRILLVNAYTHTDEGRRKYREFREILLQAIAGKNEDLEWKEYQLIERDKGDLDEFLFDLNTSYAKKEAANNFDLIDLVCMIGDINLLPWQPPAAKALILVKMCLRVKKWFFAVGFGMNALIFLSASNLQKPIRIINGNGRGSKLGDLNRTYVDPKTIGHSDYFLDHVTGDIYSYKYEVGEWIPMANTGLHYHRAAQEYDTIGKYILNTPVYRTKSQRIENQYNFIESAEAICRLKKHEYSHWLFTDVNPEFIVASKSKWQVHPFSFVDPAKVFAVLAESKSGAMVIEYKNIVGVQFDIQKRYPTTLQIFNNFLQEKFRKLVGEEPRQLVQVFKYRELETKDSRSHGYIFKKNGDVLELKGTDANNPLGVRIIDNSSQNKNRRQLHLSTSNSDKLSNQLDFVQQKVFMHSGYASKHKGPQIVVQNAIGSDKIQAPKKLKKISEDGFSNFEEKELSAIKTENFLSGGAVSPKSEAFQQRYRALRQTTRATLDSRKTEFTRPDSLSPASPTSNHGLQSHYDSFPTEGDALPSFTKSEVRSIIYPRLNKEFMGEDRSWIPGNLSHKEQKLEKPVIKLNEAMYNTGVFFKKSRKLKELLSETESPKQSVRQVSLYISTLEAQRKEEQENNKKILHGRFFNTSTKFSFNKSIVNPSIGKSLTVTPK